MRPLPTTANTYENLRILDRMISLLSGAGLQSPAISAQLMPTEQPGMLLHVFWIDGHVHRRHPDHFLARPRA